MFLSLRDTVCVLSLVRDRVQDDNRDINDDSDKRWNNARFRRPMTPG